MTPDQKRARARELRRRDPQPTIREIAEELDVSIGTAHRYVNPKADRRYRRATREWKRARQPEKE